MKKIKKKSKKSKPESPAEDAALWTAVSKTIDPLLNRDLPLDDFGAKASPPRTPSPPSPSSRAKRKASLRPEPVPAPPPLPELSHGQQPGLDKSTAKRLRRGRAHIEARLDLHGMTQDEARPALADFIERAWYAGKREVLVITGKGTRADGSIGVLREGVPRWLNQPENRARITAFTHAAPKDGGVGALYVRLKKRLKRSE